MLWVDWNVSVGCTGTRANFKMTFLNISNAHHHMRVRRCPLRSGESVVCCVWRCSVWFHIKVGRHQAALRCDCTSALHLMCHFLFPSLYARSQALLRFTARCRIITDSHCWVCLESFLYRLFRRRPERLLWCFPAAWRIIIVGFIGFIFCFLHIICTQTFFISTTSLDCLR